MRTVSVEVELQMRTASSELSDENSYNPRVVDSQFSRLTSIQREIHLEQRLECGLLDRHYVYDYQVV